MSLGIKNSAIQILLLQALTLLLISFSVATYYSTFINTDLAWHLYLASEMLNGSKLYVDYFEVNTPLVIWLTLLPAYISKLTQLNSIACIHLFNIIFTTFFFVLCCNIILKTTSAKLDSDVKRWILILAVAFVSFVMPSFGHQSEFGEKEHIFAVSFLPIVLLYLLDIRFRWNSPYLLFAILGSCVKPIFSIILLALLAHSVVLRLTERQALSLQIVLTGLFYLAVLIAHPEYYFSVAPLLLSSYVKLSYKPSNPIQSIQWTIGVIIYSSFACSVAFPTLLPTLTKQALTKFLVLIVVTLCTVLIQGKLFLYHFIPFNTFFALFICVQFCSFPTNTQWKNILIMISIFVMSELYFMQTINYLPNNFHNQNNTFTMTRKPYMDKFGELVTTHNAKSVMLLTNDMVNAFPPVLLHNLKFVTKQHSMQLLNGQFCSPTQNSKVIEWIKNDVLSGLASKPDIIIVEQPSPDFENRKVFYQLISYHFFLSGNTFEQYFLNQPWAKEYMSDYILSDSLNFAHGIFSVYVKGDNQ